MGVLHGPRLQGEQAVDRKHVVFDSVVHFFQDQFFFFKKRSYFFLRFGLFGDIQRDSAQNWFFSFEGNDELVDLIIVYFTVGGAEAFLDFFKAGF